MQPDSTDVVPSAIAPSPIPPPAPDEVESLFQDLKARLRERRPNEDLAPLEKAFRFATDLHRGQFRVSGEPYMTHPLLVTLQLAGMNMDSVCLQTGLLHDVVEDTSTTIE